MTMPTSSHAVKGGPASRRPRLTHAEALGRRDAGPARIIIAIVFAAAACLLPGCSRKPAPDPTLLAKVGTREIRVADLQRELEWRTKTRRPVGDAPTLLEDVVTEEILFQRARASGLENDPDVQRTYRRILITRLKDRELAPRLEAAQPTPEEIEALYQRQIEQYTRPAKVRLAAVHVRTDKKMSAERLAELRARAEEARREALALPPGSRGFDRVAAAYSDDQASRYKGGDLGWFDQGAAGYRWPAEIVTAGFALKNQGDMTDVLQAEDGFYVVMKLDARPPTLTPLAQVAESLRRRLALEKRQQTEQAFRQQMRQGIAVTTFPKALAAAPFPVTTLANRAEAQPPGLP